jgi:enoyl-CoA hydratase
MEDELLSEIKGNIGWMTLNRPKVLNALSLNIIREMASILQEWEENPSVQAVVIQGAGEKAFCAGGDVRAVYDAKKAGDLETCDAFFREEYVLNAHIHTYKKPYVALIDGIAMGGGLGVSINGSHRIVTEKALLAMPETGIGFFPDVGATTFLTAAPDSIGLYLGLTGYRLKPEDALWAGLATHFMPNSSLLAFKEDLHQGKPLETLLSEYCQKFQSVGFLENHRLEINHHFNQPSLKAIIESLEKDAAPFAQNTLNTLKAKSPTSLAVVFRQLKEEAPLLTFPERMKLEFRLSQHFVRSHDFNEGIRAVLVDKDQLPKWNPANLEDLTAHHIDSYFDSLGEKELQL